MENNIQVINPEQFGLEKKEALTIEEAFKPKIAEREILTAQYEEVVKKDIDKDVCKEASDIRKKLVKVRTGIASIHEKQKAYFWAAGKFVDAWKNKETLPVTQMEESLKKIENHFKILEEQEREKLRQERAAQLAEFEFEYDAGDVALLDNVVYSHMLDGIKSNYEARKEAERKAEQERIEQQRKQDLYSARKEKLIQFAQFGVMEELTIETTEKEFIAIVEKGEVRKKEFDAEQERIQKENARLKKENEAKQRKLDAERKAQAEKEQKEREAYESKLKKEREEKERIAKELREKEEAEQLELIRIKEQKEKEAEEARAAELAPDKERLTKWVSDMSIPDIVNEHMSKESVLIADEITEKFNKFKVWATAEIKKTK